MMIPPPARDFPPNAISVLPQTDDYGRVNGVTRSVPPWQCPWRGRSLRRQNTVHDARAMPRQSAAIAAAEPV